MHTLLPAVPCPVPSASCLSFNEMKTASSLGGDTAESQATLTSASDLVCRNPLVREKLQTVKLGQLIVIKSSSMSVSQGSLIPFLGDTGQLGSSRSRRTS